MRGIRTRGIVALAIGGCLVVGLIAAGSGTDKATATNSIQQAKAERSRIHDRIVHLKHKRAHMRGKYQRWIFAVRHRRAHVIAPRIATNASENAYRSILTSFHDTIHRLKRHRRAHALAIHARIVALKQRRRQLTTFIQSGGIFEYCPVQGPVTLANNFGILVDLPGVPKHIHQGDDMSAAPGTPIVAPFDGTAVATRSPLAGLGVDVYGAEGFVFNAHLSSYGQLGSVTAGTVIGYVGSTGDATGPHDHFEWHPGNGPAVDPNPYLEAIC